jgi:GT2 family glycosyltransferase
LLNNDTTIHSKTFLHLAKETNQHHFDIASPKIYFYPGREFHHQDYKKSERGKVIWYAGGRIDWHNVWAQHLGVDEIDHGQFDRVGETEFATGCCMLIHRQVLKKIGLLDSGFTAYFEDTDFSIRAIKAGFKVGFIPSSFLWHKNAGSTNGSGSTTQKKLIDKSRLRFALKHAPIRAKLSLIKHTLTHK